MALIIVLMEFWKLKLKFTCEKKTGYLIRLLSTFWGQWGYGISN